MTNRYSNKSSFVIFLFLFFFNSENFSFCQDTAYAREVVRKLASPELKGRGYMENGDKLAAEYISSELKHWGINSFRKEYLRYFKINVNTIPGSILLKIDDKLLIPGSDYIILNSSGSCEGTFDLLWIDQVKPGELLKMDLSKTFLVVDTARLKDTLLLHHQDELIYGNPFMARGIIEIKPKRTMQVERQFANPFVNLEIIHDKIPFGSKQITIRFKNKLLKKYKTQNLVGYSKGECDTFIVFGAHYDHLGMMGDSVYFPGANDNASGCSMLLNLAEYYSKPENKTHYSIAYIFFSAEEVGLLGSKAYTEDPIFPLSRIRLMVNLDLVGTGEEGIMVVNGTVCKKEYDLFTSINDEKKYLVKIGARGEAANSDHYFFYKHGVRAIFVYTRGGISEYHNIYDRAETLPLTEFEDLFRLIRDFVRDLHD
jgi:Ni,Fe-hydrogenase III component G